MYMRWQRTRWSRQAPGSLLLRSRDAQKWPFCPTPTPPPPTSVWFRVKLDPSHLTFGGSDERRESQGHSCEGVSMATHAPLCHLPTKGEIQLQRISVQAVEYQSLRLTENIFPPQLKAASINL